MDETGKVVKVKNGEATVHFERKSACKSCGMCFATGDDKKVSLILKNTINAKEGDTVRVSSSGASVLSSILLVYGVPLILFFVGLIAAHLAFHNDLVTFLTGFVFLVGGYIILNRIDKKLGSTKKSEMLPQIVSIERDEEDKTKQEEFIKNLEKEIIN